MRKLIFKLRRLLSKQTVKLLCIGVEESKWAGTCFGSAKDARSFYNIVKDRCDSSKLLISSEATKSNVLNELKKVCNSDLAIVYYSGHGGQIKGNKNETDGKDEILGLYDTHLVDNEIWNIVSIAKGRVFLIFDCCHSETMFRCAPSLYTRNNEIVDLLCWSACGEQANSYGDEEGGIFTSCLLKYLKPSLTYYKVWKKIEKNKKIAQYEIAHSTKLKGKSGFDGKKIFS